jgi:hypothetical protein
MQVIYAARVRAVHLSLPTVEVPGMTKVHFSVMTHDRSTSLAVMLESIEIQRSTASVEITILDNASHSRHAVAVEQITRRHGARLIRSDRNLFIAGKRMLEDEIFASVKPDVLVRVDDDVVLAEGWLDAVLSTLNAGAGACGSVEDHDGDLAISGQRRFHLTSEMVCQRPVMVWDWQWDDPDLGVSSEVVELAGQRALAVDGRAAFETRHDPVFLIGGEDADYSLRLRAAGHELRVASGAMIKHRTMSEGDVPGCRVADNVIPSWQHFHRRWGFIRRSAAAEAGMSFEQFVDAVVGGQR